MLAVPILRVNLALLPSLCLLSAVIALASASASASAEDWPRHRGPDLSGISSEADFVTSGEASVAWTAEIGLGYSTPVVSGGKVVVSGHDGKDSDTLYCFDEKSGEVKWQYSYAQALGDLYFQGGTTGSATFDDGKIFLLARQGEIMCLSEESGELIWSKHLQDDFGYSMPTWGFSGAPLVQGDSVYFNAGEAGLALNKKDGSVIWKSEDEEAGYSTPYPFEKDGKSFLIFTNKRYYVCVDSVTGAKTWEYKWMTRYGVNAADPIVVGDDIFISSGYGKGAALIKWTGQGDPERVWQSRDLKTQMNAALLIDGFLYGIDGNEGQDETGLKCVEWSTGETKWLVDGLGHGAVSAVGDQLVVVSENGKVQIGQASPSGFKPTFSQELIKPKVWTVPVVANGRIYLRNAGGSLVVVELK